MRDFSCVGAGGVGKKDHLMNWVLCSQKFGMKGVLGMGKIVKIKMSLLG